MANHDIGTPTSANRKQRRLHSPFPSSPLNELDGLSEDGKEEEAEPKNVRQPAFESAGPSGVTLEGISALLDTKMGPMQRSMAGLERQMGELNVSVDERLGKMEARMDKTDIRITKLEHQIVTMPANMVDPKLAQQLKDIEKEIEALKDEPHHHASPPESAKELTAVIGGLWSLNTFEEAEAWVRDKLWSLWTPAPAEVYVKFAYKNIVFVRFSSKADRDAAVQALQALKGTKDGNNDVWAKESLPLEDRVRKSMLLGVKYMLGNWGFKKSLMKVDDEYISLKCDKKTVLTVSVTTGGLVCNWDADWKTWAELQNCEEMKELITRTSEQLKKGAAASKGKGFTKDGSGLGKGPF